jgi:hypothetical protein
MDGLGGRGGIGDPLARNVETKTAWLLDRSLTLPITGSTIKRTSTDNAMKIEVFFIMVEPLLSSTIKKIQIVSPFIFKTFRLRNGVAHESRDAASAKP